MKSHVGILYSLIFVCFGGKVFTQNNSKISESPFLFEASYTGDIVNNLKGGIKSGSCYLGMANLHINFDVGKAGWWNGAQFYVNAANTHGTSPTAKLLGDMQVASNIDAGNHTFIQELWMKQTIWKVEITAGLQDLNFEFAASENGAVFLNSSFGILPSISGNIAAPIFPLTTMGLTAKWKVSEETALLVAIYDGSPTDFDYNPHNLNWRVSAGDGVLAITELQKTIEIKEHPGTYKLGIYTHNHLIETNFIPDFPDSLNNSIFGIYGYADQKVWQHAEKQMGLFAQLGYSPSETSNNELYFGFGANITGLFCSSKTDILGLAFAHANFNDNQGSESAIELTYQRQIAQNIFLQPDLQYIINPSGNSSNLGNCLVATLRFGVSF